MNVATATAAMLQCAIWSSTDEDGEPLDYTFTVEDITPGTVAELEADFIGFLEDAGDDIAASGLSDEQIGHDFWLTRNGHGAGFWDRGLGEVGERLTKAAKVWTGIDLYVGDDNRIHAL